VSDLRADVRLTGVRRIDPPRGRHPRTGAREGPGGRSRAHACGVRTGLCLRTPLLGLGTCDAELGRLRVPAAGRCERLREAAETVAATTALNRIAAAAPRPARCAGSPRRAEPADEVDQGRGGDDEEDTR